MGTDVSAGTADEMDALGFLLFQDCGINSPDLVSSSQGPALPAPGPQGSVPTVLWKMMLGI